jgi:hypothetical protein
MLDFPGNDCRIIILFEMNSISNTELISFFITDSFFARQVWRWKLELRNGCFRVKEYREVL